MKIVVAVLLVFVGTAIAQTPWAKCDGKLYVILV